jgi:hypothetical protein
MSPYQRCGNRHQDNHRFEYNGTCRMSDDNLERRGDQKHERRHSI